MGLRRRLSFHRGPLCALALASALLFLPTLCGKAYLPGAEFLARTAPWAGTVPSDPARAAHNADNVRALYPEVLFTAEEWRAGRLPAWNPRVHCGAPHWANPNAQALNPFYLPFFLRPTPRVYGLTYLLLHLGLSLSVYACLYGLFASRLGATAGALAVGYAPWTLFWMQSGEPILQTFLWFPLAVLALRKSAEAGRRWLPLGAAAVAGMVVAGHAQVYAFGFASLLLFAAVDAGRATLARRLSSALGILALGLALSAVVLLPFLHEVLRSHRQAAGDPSPQWMQPWQAVSYLFPGFLGNVFDDAQWIPCAPAAYAGLALLAAAAAGISARRGKPLPWAVLGMLALSAALVFSTPLSWTAAQLPGWSVVKRFYKMDGFLLFWLAAAGAWALPRLREEAGSPRAAARFLGWTGGICGVGALALYAAAALAPERTARAVSDVASGLSDARLSFYAKEIYPEEVERLRAHYGAMTQAVVGRWRSNFHPGNASTWWPVWLALAGALTLRRTRPALCGAALAFLALVDLLPNARFAWSQHAWPADFFPSLPAFERLRAQTRLQPSRVLPLHPDGKETAPPGMLSPYGLEVPDGFYSLNTEPKMRLTAWLNRPGAPFKGWDVFGNQTLRAIRHPAVDLMNVRFVLAPVGSKPDPEAGLRFVRREGTVDLWENPRCLPRVRWIPSATRCDPEGTLRRLAGELPFDPRREVLLPDGEAAGPPPEAGGDGECSLSWTAVSPMQWLIQTRSGRPGLVAISQAWEPGWEALLDGRSATILLADGMFQAVALPEGAHRLELRYLPPGFWIGAIVSAATLSAMAIWILRLLDRAS